MHSSIIDQFTQHQYKNLPYNLYCPKTVSLNRNETSTEYPLVIFIHDAGNNGSDPLITLKQGNGAPGFARAFGMEHPAFILAPQIPQEVRLTEDDFSCAPEIETIKELIDLIVDKYPVDRSRIYYTGQSQGCMAGCELNIRYPDYFTASLLVAGQWDPKRMGVACVHQNLWILVSDGDEKAYPGMLAVIKELEQNGAKVGRYHWNARWSPDQMKAAVQAAAGDGANIHFTIFDDHSVIPEGEMDDPVTNHIETWAVVYQIEELRQWLFSQKSVL